MESDLVGDLAPGTRVASAGRSVGHVFFEFLPPTQTFIRNLILAHRQYTPTVLSRTVIDSLGFESTGVIELLPPRSNPASRLRRSVRRRAGRWDAHFESELHNAANACDILHSHFGPTGRRSVRVAQRLGIPSVTTFYGWDLALPGSGTAALENYQELFEIGTLFFCEGPAMSEHLVRIGCPMEKIRIIPIPIDPAQFEFQPRRQAPALRLIQTGRLVEKKGTDLSLRAFAAAAGPRRGWELWIVGDGPERRALEGLASELGIASAVKFFGNLPHERYRELLAQAHIGLQPSRTAADGDTEGGAPTVLLEMQASGMPVIGSLHADIPFVVAEQTALVAEEDYGALAETLIATAEADPGQLLARLESSRRSVLERHSADRVAELVEGAYDDAISSRSVSQASPLLA